MDHKSLYNTTMTVYEFQMYLCTKKDQNIFRKCTYCIFWMKHKQRMCKE